MGMVSFDVPFARIDAKGLGYGGLIWARQEGQCASPAADRAYKRSFCRVVALFSPATRDEAAAGLRQFRRSNWSNRI